MNSCWIERPCKHCPFRKESRKGWLGRERATEIVNAASFVCHKTLSKRRKQCAGHMLVSRHNIMMRMLKKAEEPTGYALAFDSASSFIKHHA